MLNVHFVLAVVRISGITSFLLADRLTSCVPWFKIDKWVGMFGIVVIDGNCTRTTIDSYSDIIFSLATASHLGSLENV